MAKKIKIDENVENTLLDYLISESYIPKPEIVLQVMSIINSGFKPIQELDVDANGEPIMVWNISRILNNQPVQTLKYNDFISLLDSNPKIRVFIKKDEDRKKFLEQIVKDWINNEKSLKNGLLSKNYV